MKIEVPRSFFDYIHSLQYKAHMLSTTEKPYTYSTHIITVQGPYGCYDIVARDDKDYTVLIREETEEKIVVRHEIREYKE